MDIYSARSSLQRVLEFIETKANSEQKRMYAKSKIRYKELAEMCSTIVELVSVIVQENAMDCDPEDFESSSELKNIVSDMSASINSLGQFISYSGDITISQNDSSSSAVKLSKADRKYGFKSYIDVLHVLSDSNLKIPVADRCAKLLWRWFDSRFVQNGRNINFRYNICKFPMWITHMILWLGKHVQLGTLDTAEGELLSWISDVPTQYFAVPYDVYKFEKEISDQDVSLAAAVLWDILFDSGLKSLSNIEQEALRISSYDVLDICYNTNSKVLDTYVHYSDEPEVLQRCNMGGDAI